MAMNWFDAEQQVLRTQDEAHRQSRTVAWPQPERPSRWSRLAGFFSRRKPRPEKAREQVDPRPAFPNDRGGS
jgi:hypothetical protein